MKNRFKLVMEEMVGPDIDTLMERLENNRDEFLNKTLNPRVPGMVNVPSSSGKSRWVSRLTLH